MISLPSIFAGSLAAALFLLSVALFLLSVALFPRGWWRRVNKRFYVYTIRARKYWRVRYRQMSNADRQTYAMGAGIVIFFVWWSVAIAKGW